MYEDNLQKMTQELEKSLENKKNKISQYKQVHILLKNKNYIYIFYLQEN